MLQAWLALGEQGTRDTVDDAAALALHVLTYAGFGVKYAFKDSETKLKAPHRLTYRDALLCVIRNFYAACDGSDEIHELPHHATKCAQGRRGV